MASRQRRAGKETSLIRRGVRLIPPSLSPLSISRARTVLLPPPLADPSPYPRSNPIYRNTSPPNGHTLNSACHLPPSPSLASPPFPTKHPASKMTSVNLSGDRHRTIRPSSTSSSSLNPADSFEFQRVIFHPSSKRRKKKRAKDHRGRRQRPQRCGVRAQRVISSWKNIDDGAVKRDGIGSFCSSLLHCCHTPSILFALL